MEKKITFWKYQKKFEGQIQWDDAQIPCPNAKINAFIHP
jgi:hypothetical protein